MNHNNCEEINRDISEDVTENKATRIEEKSKQHDPGKRIKRGIIYLSMIPKNMNVAMIRETFSHFGKVGRVYLQLEQNDTQPKHNKKRKVNRRFTEGWVEFESKKIAKSVAANLNNTRLSTRKRSILYDTLWNIKYLPGFKWIHLSERLAYERVAHNQRLRAEIAQAKKEVNVFSHNIDKSRKLNKKQAQGKQTNFVVPEIKQRDTDNEIRSRKPETHVEDRTEFLKSIFG